MKDIETPDDCLYLVEQFYNKLLNDPDISHHFSDLDLKPHIQLIADFWSTILLGTQLYKNNTIAAHQHLNLKKDDFDIWLRHFYDTLDSLFAGDKTEEARSRARTIGLTMRYKLLGS